MRKNVYVKSNPEELERFKNFVEDTVPYDCVIDGLNVAYSMGNQKSPAVYARIVRKSFLLIKNAGIVKLGKSCRFTKFSKFFRNFTNSSKDN